MQPHNDIHTLKQSLSHDRHSIQSPLLCCVSGAFKGQRAPARDGRQSRQAERRPQALPLLHILPVSLTCPAPAQTSPSLSLPNPVNLLPHPAASAALTCDHPQVRGWWAESDVSPTDAPASHAFPPLGLSTHVLPAAS